MVQENRSSLFKKTNMKKIYSLFILLALGSQLKAQLPSDLQNRLSQAFDSVCTKYQVKGASASVLYPGSGTWNGTYGVSHGSTSITPEMVFGIGSNTKTFISALLLQLQEEELLSLDDSIGNWVHNRPNINGAVTIRQCLNHTSGFRDYLQNNSINDSIDQNVNKIWTVDELLMLVGAPDFAPGTDWDYSNTNYIIAGMIIKAVLNKPVEESIRERILAPAGLNHTYFYGEPNSTDYMPHQWSMNITGTNLTDLNLMPAGLLPNLFSMATTAGAMVSTAEDNAKFWYMLNSGKIISQASLKEMHTLVSIGGGVGYGLGIFFYSRALNGRSFYSHGGTFFGFINENMYDTTSGVSISVMTNQDSIGNNRLLSSFISALHKITVQQPVGIRESAYNNRAFSVYPNPAAEAIHIRYEEKTTGMTLTISDLTGNVQYTTAMDYRNEWPVSDLATGLYIIRISNKNGEVLHTQKLQINR